MEFGMDLGTLLTGILVFAARVTDVTLGTVRTISIVHGRTKIAFFLGFIEVSLWLIVIATILPRVLDRPILGVFYALGFSMGNVVGIFMEKKMAFGNIVLRIISLHNGPQMADKIRGMGYGVTTFAGEGLTGPVLQLNIVCRRKNLKEILNIVKDLDADAFFLTEPAENVSKLYRPVLAGATGWRAIFKKK
jgi:uncharacterized protein YebE (UPF0316 family)